MPQPRNTPPLLAQLVAGPLLIDAGAEQLFQESVKFIVNHEHAETMLSGAMAGSDSDEDFWPQPDAWESAYRPYNVKDGTLQIPVMGVLLNRFPYQLGRWATGYKYIEQAVRRGRNDDNVKRIALIEHTPGGEVAGCFELADEIYDGRSEKPIWAFSADAAYSAGYALASATQQIVVTRSGGVGSVGVVTAHFDYSGMMEDFGVKVTFIFKGKHKVDGNPYEKLSDQAKQRIDKRIEKLYSVFTSTVARNRGMEEDAVRATEALTYDATDGIDIGFADRLGALEDELAIFADEATTGDDDMADVKQEVHEKAVADARTEGAAAGKVEGLKEGATAERERINAIMNSEEGKKRPKAAHSTAMNTDMSVEAATKFLATLDEETPEAKANPAEPTGEKPNATGKTETSHFETAMNKGNPEVGAEVNDDEEVDASEAATNSILADYGGVVGKRSGKAA